jgi:hypothetical protein
MISVSFNGRKLFDWKGDAKEAAQIAQDVAQIAALNNETPETLWHATLLAIADNGCRFFSGAPYAEIMIVISGLLLLPADKASHSDAFRDYLESSDFDFNIKVDPENADNIEIEAKAIAEGRVN